MHSNSVLLSAIVILKKKPKGTVFTTTEEDFLTCKFESKEHPNEATVVVSVGHKPKLHHLIKILLWNSALLPQLLVSS